MRILTFLAVLTVISLAQAQVSITSIVGTVKDISSAIVPGASVTVKSSTGRFQTAVTNERGEYSILGLPPGTYSVSVTAANFNAFEKDGLAVAQGQSLTVDATLEPAGVAASVNVASQKVAEVQTETAEVSGTITKTEIVSLGLNGRNFTQLIALTPGVSNQTGQDEAKVGVLGSVKYSVNGGRVEYNTFDVDGSDLLNVGINGANSTLIVYPSLDAIQEVRVLTSNYGAMYGRTASGTVLVTTKSGTAEFHGNGYYFNRNEVFNARNFFDETKGAPLYRRHDLGFTIGGPVYIPNRYNTKKDKTFFFFSEEYRNEKSPVQYNQAVPSLAERNGDFSDVCPPASIGVFTRSKYPDCPDRGFDSGTYLREAFPNNQLNGYYSQLDRNALAILNTGIIPAPNSTGGCNSTIGSCYDITVSPPTHWREELFRVDHYFTPTSRLTFRYIHDAWNTVVTTPQWGTVTNNFPTIENNFIGPGITMVGRFTQTLSPTLLNDVLFSYTNSNITLTDTDGPGAQWQRPSALDNLPCTTETNAVGTSAEQCPMGYLFNNGFGGKMPGIVIAGNNQEYGGNGFAVDAGYMPWKHTNPIYTFGDSVSKVVGKHTLQFGSQLIIYQRDQTNNAIGAATGDVQGILTFSNVASAQTTGNAFADFLFHGATYDQGAIKSYTQDSAQLTYKQRYIIAEPYFQDDWRVNSRLTLNLGLRLSLFGTYHEENGNAYNWVPSAYSQTLASQVSINSYTGSLQDSQPDPITGNLNPVPLDLTNLDPRITNGLVRCGTNGVPAGCMQGHWFNWAPRIGFAWDPFGNGKTSLRWGYGIFYEHGAGNEANTGSLEASSPLVLSMTQNFPYGWSSIGGVDSNTSPVAYPLNVTAIPTKAVWPYVQQWSMSIQRELPWNTVATVAYVGSKGTHLTDQVQLNQLPPVPASENPYSLHEPFLPVIYPPGTNGEPVTGDCATYSGTPPSFTLTNGAVVKQGDSAYNNLIAACYGQIGIGAFPDPNSFRKYLGLGRIVSLENSANSSYNALQATLRRTEGPLTLGVSYSYSHSFDDSSDRSDANFVDSYDLRGNWASSNFDQRHLLNISYIYDLPLLKFFSFLANQPITNPSKSPRNFLNGWQLSGITVYQSGTPFSVLNGGGAGVYAGGVSVPDNAGVANGAGLGSYPDIIGNPYGPVPEGGNNGRSFGPLLLNPGAFGAPRGLTFGDAGRNALNNPSRLNFDTALLKHFTFSETRVLEFRAEVFNVFNHTQFQIYDANRGNTANNTISCYGGPLSEYSAGGSPGTNCLTGSAFLHPVDAHRPRTMQLGIKFSF